MFSSYLRRLLLMSFACDFLCPESKNKLLLSCNLVGYWLSVDGPRHVLATVSEILRCIYTSFGRSLSDWLVSLKVSAMVTIRRVQTL